MNGWFEIHRSKDDQVHFDLKAGNGETILSSELYRAKASALAGIASVQVNCADDKRYERAIATNKQPYFNLRAANQQVIGTSQRYSSTSAMEAGIASVKANGLTKTIKDNT